jgi:hypothetical protein
MKYFRSDGVLTLTCDVAGRAATNDKQDPDREMLRMMDFLRNGNDQAHGVPPGHA